MTGFGRAATVVKPVAALAVALMVAALGVGCVSTTGADPAVTSPAPEQSTRQGPEERSAGSAGRESAASSAELDSAGLWLNFEELEPSVGEPARPITNSGTWQLRITTLTAAGGAVRTDPGRDGLAARFPSASHTQPVPAAVIRIERTGENGQQPGLQRFRIGADFRIESDSSSGPGDNGNNVLQRGLWGDTAQYKIQIDHGRPSCLVRGAAGEVYVEADIRVVPGHWYRVTCERQSQQVVLRLMRFHSDGAVSSQMWVGTGRTGRLDLEGVWLSVGGKVSWKGLLVSSASDQFNGWLDNVTVEVLGHHGQHE